MKPDLEIIFEGCDREGDQFLRLREGERELVLWCSLGYSKIEFSYHTIRKWEYPFEKEPLSEEDRARLVAGITEHYTRKGWDLVIDRRRFCPRCNEILPLSQYENWPGAICDFCGKRIDRFGNIVPHLVQIPKIFRPTVGVRTLLAVLYVVAIVLLSIWLPFNIPARYKVIIVPCFAIFGAFGLADVFLSRIVLQSDGIQIVSISDFQSRVIPRAEIESVNWEKGGGAYLVLRDGKLVKLPNVGQTPQGLTNTISAWLKQTEVPT